MVFEISVTNRVISPIQGLWGVFKRGVFDDFPSVLRDISNFIFSTRKWLHRGAAKEGRFEPKWPFF
jgi:hypothetical protein